MHASAFKDHRMIYLFDTFVHMYGEMLLNHSTLHRFVLFYFIIYLSFSLALSLCITWTLPLQRFACDSPFSSCFCYAFTLSIVVVLKNLWLIQFHGLFPWNLYMLMPSHIFLIKLNLGRIKALFLIFSVFSFSSSFYHFLVVSYEYMRCVRVHV